MENDKRQMEKDFQSFFTVNFPKVKNFARKLLKSDEDAEDVAQDVFVNCGNNRNCGNILMINWMGISL